jgi:hypothetical protein
VVQVFLTLAVLWVMGMARQHSIRERGQTIEDMALAGDADWSDEALKRNNNYKNQFELPVLFYAACLFALELKIVDAWVLGLASAFALTRVVHAVVHIGPNIVLYRGSAFLAGYVVLALLWIVIGVRGLTGASPI